MVRLAQNSTVDLPKADVEKPHKDPAPKRKKRGVLPHSWAPVDSVAPVAPGDAVEPIDYSVTPVGDQVDVVDMVDLDGDTKS